MSTPVRQSSPQPNQMLSATLPANGGVSALMEVLQREDSEQLLSILGYILERVYAATLDVNLEDMAAGEDEAIDLGVGLLSTQNPVDAGSTTAGNRFELTPATLRLLLHLYIEKTSYREWRDVGRLTVALVKALVHGGFGEVIADALLYNEVRLSSEAEAQCCLMNFSLDTGPLDEICGSTPALARTDEETGTEEASRAQFRELTWMLLSAQQTDHLRQAADIFQTLMEVEPLLDRFLEGYVGAAGSAAPNVDSGAHFLVAATFYRECETANSPPPQQPSGKRSSPSLNYGLSSISHLLTSPVCSVCVPVWRSVRMLLTAHPAYAVDVLARCNEDVTSMLVTCLESRSFIARQSALSLTEEIVASADLSIVCTAYLSSAALVGAVLQVTNEVMSCVKLSCARVIAIVLQHLSIAASPCVPVQSILWENHKELHRFFNYCADLPGVDAAFYECMGRAHGHLDALPIRTYPDITP